MRRREFVAGLATASAAFTASAQAPRVARVGLLAGATREIETDRIDVLKKALADLGWREGATLQLEERYGDGSAAKIARHAAELIAQRPDIIVCVGATEARALQAGTQDIPILFMQVPDPAAVGLIESIARPGHNVTGLSAGPHLLWGKRVEMLTELLARQPRRLTWLGNPANAGTERNWDDASKAASQAGAKLMRAEVTAGSELDSVFARLDAPDAVLVQWDFLLYSERKRIAELAMRHRLPAMYENRGHVVNGGLISFGADLRDNFRRGAGYVDRLLKGTRPADLPVDQASRFELVINVDAAQAIDLEVPSSLLARADEVI
jgi:putative ABC transport system substrate-binding protein